MYQVWGLELDLYSRPLWHTYFTGEKEEARERAELLVSHFLVLSPHPITDATNRLSFSLKCIGYACSFAASHTTADSINADQS